MTWDYLAQLRETTSMRIVIKGIVTSEDAASCVQYGADAVYVSNHGGRAEASGRGSLDSLSEVAAAGISTARKVNRNLLRENLEFALMRNHSSARYAAHRYQKLYEHPPAP